MKKAILRSVALILAVISLLSLCACSISPTPPTEPAPVNAGELVQKLLDCVRYDAPLTDAGDAGAMFFQGLPEYALVTMYSGSGYFADELVWITLAQKEDMDAALDSVDTHIAQVREQFLSYIPEEVPKIDNARIWTQGVHIIVCITNDYETVDAVIADPDSAVPLTAPVVTEAPTDAPTEAPTEAPTDAVTEPATEQKDPDVTLNANGYPAIVSVAQTTRDFGAACVVDNAAYEYYGYDQSAAQYYTSLVNTVATSLQGKTDVYSLLIPTATGIVFPDNLAEKFKDRYENQHQRMLQIFGMMDPAVIQVDCYETLMQHRNEYLYFRTDWHWNGPGAYYAYETFCKVKGITPYTMEQRRLSTFDGYLGALYQQTCNRDPALAETPDTVYAYHPYSENAYMYFTDSSGNRYSWNIISDVSGHSADAKYYTFAASDQPYAEFYNPDVTDGSVAIVVKESYGNVLMSYLVDHYSTIYEIDYRYWSGDLVDFANQVEADDIIFANNLSMIRSNYLVGLMDKIIP